MDEPKDAADRSKAPQVASAASPNIDIEKLAEKVYLLMIAEVRLAQSRGYRRGYRR